MDIRYKKAARLVALGIKDKKGTQRDTEFRELIKQAREDLEFRDIVDLVADGFGVKILSFDDNEDFIVVPSSIDGPFVPNVSFFRSSRSNQSSKMMFLIMSLSLVASYFPNSDILYDSSRSGKEGRKPERLVKDLKETCEKLRTENEDKTGQLNRILDEILKMPDIIPKANNDKTRGNTTSIIGYFNYVLKYYTEIGFLKKYTNENGEHYIIMSRFEQHIREFGLVNLSEVMQSLSSKSLVDKDISLTSVENDTDEFVMTIDALMEDENV
jgi:hypothetical protein